MDVLSIKKDDEIKKKLDELIRANVKISRKKSKDINKYSVRFWQIVGVQQLFIENGLGEFL